MRILGFIETSFSDWDGKIASVVFTGGCNFRCPFCHNHRIADDDPSLQALEWETIEVDLLRKQEWVDGVVFSGGEPLMHPEIFDLCRRTRGLGFRVKVDTNGSFPYVLSDLIESRLADFVAMDLKAPLDEKYSLACGRPLDLAPIRRAIRFIIDSGIDHEFRTTLARGLVDPEDIPAIGRAVQGAKVIALQHFERKNARVPGIAKNQDYTLAEAQRLAELLRPFVSEVKLRGKFL